jgi:hypothetical protein
MRVKKVLYSINYNGRLDSSFNSLIEFKKPDNRIVEARGSKTVSLDKMSTDPKLMVPVCMMNNEDSKYGVVKRRVPLGYRRSPHPGTFAQSSMCRYALHT